MATPTSIIIRCETEQCLITDELNVVVMYDNDSDSDLSDDKHNHHNSQHNNCQHNNNNGCESEECDVSDGDMDTTHGKHLDTHQIEEHHQKASDDSQPTESQTTATTTTITTPTVKPIIMTAQTKALRSMLKKGCARDSSNESSVNSSNVGNSNGKSAKRVTFSETMMVFCDDWPKHLMPQVVALKSPTDFNLVEAQGYMFEPPAEYQDFLPFEPPPDYRDFIANSLSAYDNDLSINFIDDDDEDSSDAHSSDNKLLTNNNNNYSSDNSHQNYINEMSSKWESMILNNSECMEEEQIIGVLREDALLQAIGSHVSLPEEHLCVDDFPVHFHKSGVRETCESVHLAESELSDITSDDGIDESSPTGSQQDIASDSSITSQDTIILINDNDDDNNASYIALNNIDLSDDLTNSEIPAKSEECCLVVDNNNKVVVNTNNASTSGDDIDIVTILENRLNKEKLDNNNERELNDNNRAMSENEFNNPKHNLDSSNTNVTSNSNNGYESEECNINDGIVDTTDATHLDINRIEEQQTCDDSRTTVCDGQDLVNNALSDDSVPDDDKNVLTTVIASCGACSSSTASSDDSQMNDTQCATDNASFKRNLMFYENMLSESNKMMESNAVKTKSALKQTTCAPFTPFIICSQSNTNPSSTTSYIVVTNNRTDDNKCEKYVNENNLLDNSSGSSNNKCAKNLLTGDNDNSIDYNNVNHRSIKVNGEAIQMMTHPNHTTHPPPPHPHQHQRCLQPNHHNWPSDEFIIEYTSEPRTLVPSKRTSSLSSFPNALAMSNSNSNNQQKVMINNANYMSLNRVSCDAQQQLKQWRLYTGNNTTNTNTNQQHSACPHIVRYQYQQQRLQRPLLPPNHQQPQQQFFLIRPQFTRAQYPSPPPQTNPNQCSYSPQSSQPQPIQRCRSPVPPVPHHTHTQLPLQRPPQHIAPQQQQQPQQQPQPLRTVIRFTNSMSQTLPHPHKQPPPYDYHILAHHSNKFPHASEIRRRDGLNAYPHVLRQTPQPGSLPVPPVHHNSHNAKQMLTKDELEQFVQQDMQRTERIKKRYSLSEEDDPSFGFARRPSVRGIRPKYCSTTEIIKQMQTNSNAVSTGLQIVTNHLSWPATLNNPTNV